MRQLLLATAAVSTLLAVAACQGMSTRVPDPVIVSPPSSEFTGDRRDGPMMNPPPPTAGMDGTKGPARPVAIEGSSDWRQVVNQGDSQRILGLDDAWVSGLSAARRSNAAEVDRLGALLQPSGPRDSGQPGPALDNPQPPPGDYRCRTIKLGGDKGVPLVVYGWFRCRIEPVIGGGGLRFTKLTGSQRQQGGLYPWTDRAVAFVGAEAWGNETTYPTYGQNPERDEVGALERIGPDRWRLLLAWPKQESVLDVIELVRAS